ncbi:MAG: phosphoribosylformylglycinamidine synthase subunit PurL [Planctomycetaceae bacterium]
MLWEVEIRPTDREIDREAARVKAVAREFGADSIRTVRSAHAFLIEGPESPEELERIARLMLVDPVVEEHVVRALPAADGEPHGMRLLNVLFKPGVTDNVAASALRALEDLGHPVRAVSTCRKYWINADASDRDVRALASRVLANEAIEHVLHGPLALDSIALGSEYRFELATVLLRGMSDAELADLSKTGQLYLSLVEMRTIQRHFAELGRDPTDVELETIAQTWSEHCSHKTLAGRIHYRDDEREIHFDNMLKETIFAATQTIRERLGDDDWCVSVFRDNAGIVTFCDGWNVCMKVETHNHPSALEPYGGANTGLGGVIRDPLGTGLGAKPLCNTDVFCFAPPDFPADELPPGVLHPRIVAKGVVAGVRDYGNRMGIPTVNGAVYFDERYLGNPLVYCGNVALIPADKCDKAARPGDLIVAVGGRTGRDGIHGATFSSAELTHESETLSGGAVQIGNAITEKMLADVILQARDQGLYTAITDCGAGGFSSAVGEMGEETGAVVHLDRAPLKYAGLSYTEIWISEAQERMVLAVPPENWDKFHALCAAEGVEATRLGEFTNDRRLALFYEGTQVADLSMAFLHDGRPPVVREAVWSVTRTLGAYGSLAPALHRAPVSRDPQGSAPPDAATILLKILASWNVCSREWIIRQYDHEVQAGSVLKPLVGAADDGPSDAAVVRPLLDSNRGLVVSCGMNPRYGDLDPYWMAASAIDEAVRNCVAAGANPNRIAILDNFCWGNTERPEVLGSLVRAAIACQDVAIAYGTPFISGKDSLNNEFRYPESVSRDPQGSASARSVAIPPSLLISALGQIDDVSRTVSMDFKEAGNRLYLLGEMKAELGGSHLELVGWAVPATAEAPRVNLEQAPKIFAALHAAISAGLVRSCHDLSEGGLAVALAEMSFAGELGAEIDLAPLARRTGIADPLTLLYSESNTRFILEVEPRHAIDLETHFDDLPLCPLGAVANHDRLTITLEKSPLIDLPWSEMKTAWKTPLAWE